MTDRLNHIAAHGTGHMPRRIRCNDDTTLSIKAGPGAWSRPRPRLYGTGNAPADYAGPYTHVEVYFLTPVDLPSSWAEYDDGNHIHFGPVPIELVRDVVEEHGGEHWEQDLEHDATMGLCEAFAPEVFTAPRLDPLKEAFGRGLLGE